MGVRTSNVSICYYQNMDSILLKLKTGINTVFIINFAFFVQKRQVKPI